MIEPRSAAKLTVRRKHRVYSRHYKTPRKRWAPPIHRPASANKRLSVRSRAISQRRLDPALASRRKCARHGDAQARTARDDTPRIIRKRWPDSSPSLPEPSILDMRLPGAIQSAAAGHLRSGGPDGAERQHRHGQIG